MDQRQCQTDVDACIFAVCPFLVRDEENDQNENERQDDFDQETADVGPCVQITVVVDHQDLVAAQNSKVSEEAAEQRSAQDTADEL